MLKVRNISKSFNGLRVLEDISFEYSGDGILGIVGPNGSGKTTLLNIISGNIMPSSGDIFYEGKKINGYPLHKRAVLGMVRTYQDGKVFPYHTLREHLLLLGDVLKRISRAFRILKSCSVRWGWEKRLISSYNPFLWTKKAS